MKYRTPIILLSLTFAGSLFAQTSPFPEDMIPAIFAEDHEAQLAADLKGDDPPTPTAEAAASAETESAKLSPEAEANLAEIRQNPRRWRTFTKRWDKDGDGRIDGGEYRYYAEWHSLRIAAKDAADANGNGRLDPAEREAFREAVNALKAQYLEGEE
jgi:hypothetical protein